MFTNIPLQLSLSNNDILNLNNDKSMGLLSYLKNLVCYLNVFYLIIKLKSFIRIG